MVTVLRFLIRLMNSLISVHLLPESLTPAPGTGEHVSVRPGRGEHPIPWSELLSPCEHTESKLMKSFLPPLGLQEILFSRELEYVESNLPTRTTYPGLRVSKKRTCL